MIKHNRLVKLLIASSLFIFAAVSLSAQVTEEEKAIINAKIAAREKAERDVEFRTNLFATIGTTAYFTDDFINRKNISYVNPELNFELGAGYTFGFAKIFGFEPHLTAFFQYFSWDNDLKEAFVTGPENRTSSTITFLLDLPVITTIKGEKSKFEAGIGVGILSRINFLARGVSEKDWGSDETAGKDVKHITEWLWNPLNFIYPEALLSYTYKLENGRQVGFVARFYIPLTIYRGFKDSIISVGFKFTLPQNPASLALLEEEIPVLPPEETEDAPAAEATDTAETSADTEAAEVNAEETAAE